jgi:hypothetical protein
VKAERKQLVTPYAEILTQARGNEEYPWEPGFLTVAIPTRDRVVDSVRYQEGGQANCCDHHHYMPVVGQCHDYRACRVRAFSRVA